MNIVIHNEIGSKEETDKILAMLKATLEKVYDIEVYPNRKGTIISLCLEKKLTPNIENINDKVIKEIMGEK